MGQLWLRIADRPGGVRFEDRQGSAVARLWEGLDVGVEVEVLEKGGKIDKNNFKK